MKTSVFIYLLPHVPFGLFLIAEVTSGQGLAIGIAKTFDKSVKQVVYRFYRFEPLRVLDSRRHPLIAPGTKPEKGGSPE
jgi:hypothetical protein